MHKRDKQKQKRNVSTLLVGFIHSYHWYLRYTLPTLNNSNGLCTNIAMPFCEHIASKLTHPCMQKTTYTCLHSCIHAHAYRLRVWGHVKKIKPRRKENPDIEHYWSQTTFWSQIPLNISQNKLRMYCLKLQSSGHN